MSAPAPARDTSAWPTQTEAAVQLATNERTIRRWIEAGRLRCATRPVTGRKPVTIVDPAGIARVREERRAPVVVLGQAEPREQPEPVSETALAFRDPDARDWAFIVERAREYAAPRPKPFLALAEASDYAGLPKRFLARLIRGGALPAARHAGVWFVKRADVDALEMTK
jgi:hypothetical protein